MIMALGLLQSCAALPTENQADLFQALGMPIADDADNHVKTGLAIVHTLALTNPPNTLAILRSNARELTVMWRIDQVDEEPNRACRRISTLVLQAFLPDALLMPVVLGRVDPGGFHRLISALTELPPQKGEITACRDSDGAWAVTTPDGSSHPLAPPLTNLRIGPDWRLIRSTKRPASPQTVEFVAQHSNRP